MRGLIGILGRMVMVAVAAILIAGCLAAPTAAEQRPEAKEANDFIDYCFRAGGDPEVVEGADGDEVIVMCHNLPGVGDMVCQFAGHARDCWLKGPEHPGGVLPTQPVDGVFVENEPAQVTPQAIYEVVPLDVAPSVVASLLGSEVLMAELGGSAAEPQPGAPVEAPRLAIDETQAVTPVDAPLVVESEVVAPVETQEASAAEPSAPAAPAEAVEAPADVVETPAQEPIPPAATDAVDTPAEEPIPAASSEVVEIPAEAPAILAEEPVAAEEPMVAEASAEQP